MVIKNWNIKEMTGYEPKTTFYTDFSLAEPFGIAAICDTYTRAMNEWKNDIEYVTELSMVLNWKVWEHYKTNEVMAKMYQDLWDKCCYFIEEEAGFNSEDLTYYYNTTD